jgi:glycosyltransferase involved in cell wall biosynthesis
VTVRDPLGVLFVSSCVRGGGAGWSLYYLLKHLDRRLVDPAVVVPNPGIFEEGFARLDVCVHRSRVLPERTAQQRFGASSAVTRCASYGLNLAASAVFVGELVRLIRQERIQLVYANNMMVKPMTALAAQIAGVPCVLHVRNLHERQGAILLYCQATARLPRVRRVIANSRASAEPWIRSVPAKVRIVHNGVDLDDYARDAIVAGALRREIGVEREHLLVGFTGNLIERKGIEFLVGAARLLVAAGSTATFVVLGRVPLGTSDEYARRCEALVAEAGIGERFRFLGFAPDVRASVADLDVLVLPSLQEPFGRSIIEAMALGVPVVASRVGGIPEIIRDGIDGLLVPPGDELALADAIGRLADDSALRRRLGRAGANTVRERFDVVGLTKSIQDILVEAAV